jgi:hypothetical protein
MSAWPHRENQKPSRNQRPSWLAVALATPRCLYKVRRLPPRKAIQNQSLTRSVLNPRSPELWRQTAGEREFRVTAGASQCGGFRAKPVVIGDFCPLVRQRRMFDDNALAEGVRLGSNGLLSWCDRSSTWECDRDPNWALKRRWNSRQKSFAYHSVEAENLRISSVQVWPSLTTESASVPMPG